MELCEAPPGRSCPGSGAPSPDLPVIFPWRHILEANNYRENLPHRHPRVRERRSYHTQAEEVCHQNRSYIFLEELLKAMHSELCPHPAWLGRLAGPGAHPCFPVGKGLCWGEGLRGSRRSQQSSRCCPHRSQGTFQGDPRQPRLHSHCSLGTPQRAESSPSVLLEREGGMGATPHHPRQPGRENPAAKPGGTSLGPFTWRPTGSGAKAQPWA